MNYFLHKIFLFCLFKHSACSHTTIYESVKDLKIEQHAKSIMVEQLQAGLMKLRRHVKYQRLDEQLKQLVPSFDLISRDTYFKLARAFYIFDTYLLNLLR